MKHWGRAAAAVVAGIAALSLTGCVVLGDKLDQARWNFGTIPFYIFDNAKTYHEPPQAEVMEEPVNLAIAISGGGSRSAVFASAVLEQLALMPDPTGQRATLLDRADVISAVSGGSLAATYYSMHKPATFSDAAETAQFFQSFKSHMSVDFVRYSATHYLSHPWEAVAKYYTRQRFSQTLANTFDQYLYKGTTFENLQATEAGGRGPVLMINATDLDSGKRFLFTNLNVQKQFSINVDSLQSRVNKLYGTRDATALAALGQVVASPLAGSFGFDSIDSDIGLFRVADAVAASSAYPVIPGPFSLINYRNEGYVHLADGGVSDNSGIDSIVQLFLSRLQDARSPRRLIVLALDVSRPLRPERDLDPDGYVGAIRYGERAASVLGTRGAIFADAIYRSTAAIQIVHLNMIESERYDRLRGKLATYAISEKDFHEALGCGHDVVRAHAEEIKSALLGNGGGR